MAWRRGKFSIVVMILQIIFLALFAVFVKYSPEADPLEPHNNMDGGAEGNASVKQYYTMFQDVHVMMFVGFGFLMTFMKRYSFSSVGLNFLVAAFSIQWASLVNGFLHLHDGKIELNALSLLLADFASASVLISFGAVLGRVSPLQLIIMALFEITIYQINEWIGFGLLGVTDIGDSMFVHVFGAYFGLAVSATLYKKDITKHEDKQGSAYTSDIFAMIGTVFLWMFWPSFNGGAAEGDEQHRSVINTYYSLAACCVVTFVISAFVSKEDKFDMVHVQNATLAGGVAVGTSANLMIHPWGAILIGSLAGILSVLGFKYLTPFLARRLKLQDQCGVHNLHGMPGVMAAIIGAIVTSLASEETYGYSLYQIWPSRAPVENSTELLTIQKQFSIEAGYGRTASKAAAFQMAALGITLALAIVGGLVTGVILRLRMWNEPDGTDLYDDMKFWEVPEDHLPGFENHGSIGEMDFVKSTGTYNTKV